MWNKIIQRPDLWPCFCLSDCEVPKRESVEIGLTSHGINCNSLWIVVTSWYTLTSLLRLPSAAGYTVHRFCSNTRVLCWEERIAAGLLPWYECGLYGMCLFGELPQSSHSAMMARTHLHAYPWKSLGKFISKEFKIQIWAISQQVYVYSKALIYMSEYIIWSQYSKNSSMLAACECQGQRWRKRKGKMGSICPKTLLLPQ